MRGHNSDDTFHVGLEAGNLTEIRGALLESAGANGDSAAIVSDRNAGSGNGDVQLSGNTFSGIAGPSDNVPLYFDRSGGNFLVAIGGSESVGLAERFTLDGFFHPLLIESREGEETFDVRALTAAATPRGEEGDEQHAVGNGLGFLADTLTIDDALGNNAIEVDDAGFVGGRIYELNDSALSLFGTGHDEIVMGETAGTFYLVTTDGSDQFRALGTPSDLSVNVDLGGGSNVLVGPDADTR